jgi:hypothetical protein
MQPQSDDNEDNVDTDSQNDEKLQELLRRVTDESP